MKNKFLKLMALFVASAFVGNAGAQDWTPSSVGEGTYYLYNVGAEKFLCSGNNWGSHASVTEGGIPITLAGSGNVYTISTAAIYADKYLNDVWMDGSTYDWTFEEVSTGVYKLKNGDNVLYWNGGTSTNTTMGTDPGTTASQWMLVTEEARVAALSNATAEAPINATFLIKNAYFAKGNGHYFVRTGGYNSLSTSTSWKGTDFTDFWGSDVETEDACYAVEQYGKTFDNYQELTVPNGKYFMTAKGFYNGNVVPYIYANSEKCDLKVKGTLTKADGTVADNIESGAIALRGDDYLLDGVTVVVTDGSLRVGVKSDSNISWCVFDDFELVYYGELDLSEFVTTYEAALTKAQTAAASTAKMETATMAALNTAISTYGNVDKTNQAAMEEAIAALNTATDNVNASIAAYTNVPAYFTKMAGVLDNTNVYTQEAYDAYYGDWLAAYEDGTLATATAATLYENSAYSTGWHSTNYIDDILLSAWTIGGEQANNYDKALYINTWSTEGNTDGSEFLAPFFEYWTADANSLGANTIQAKIVGLEAETQYSFTIRARVRQTNDKTKITEGITMQVGEGTAVDISAGAQFGTGQFYIGNFTAVGETDAEGTLTATITVAENSNISWLSFYNAKYTEGEDLSAYIADYEFALANANTALGKGMDPNLRSALQSTVNTYSTVDNTDKAALITAKEALDKAVAAVATSVAALDGSDLSAWTTTGNNGKFEVNTWSNEGNTDGSNMKVPFAQNWIAKGTNLGDVTMSYTLTDQTPGYYKISGLVRSLNEAGGATPAGVFLFANDAIERAYNGTSCTNGVYATPVVYGLVGEDGVLTIGIKIIGANVNWVAWKNLTIEYVGTTLTSDIATNLTEEAPTFEYNLTAKAAVESAVSALATLSDANYTAAGKAIETAYKEKDMDFTALNEAIAAKDDYTLGFAAGEYAPYTNVAVMEALAAAKAINQETETVQANVIAATEALNAAAWVANTEEMNAIYDGSFEHDYSAIEGNVKPLGWNRTSGENTGYQVRYITNVPEGATSSNKGMFIKFTANYGKDAGYTMPLKANTVYALSFVYTGWGNNPTVNILVKDEEGNEVAITPASIKANADGQTDASNWQTYKGVFTTGDADANYILYFDKSEDDQLQIAFGDFKLMKAETKEVTMNISDAKYATFIAPFDVEIPEGVTASKITGVEGDVLTEEAIEGTIPANTPVVLYSENLVSKTFSGQSLATADAYTEGLLTGTYVDYQTTANTNTYVLQNNDGKAAFYLVGESAQPWIRANRCYMVYEAAAGAPMFSLERGEGTTSIEDAELTNENVVIYDLAGRRVEKMEKGIYIVNGKKVIR